VEAVVLTNRAVVLCIQGQLLPAHDILLSVVTAFPAFAPAIRTLVYVCVRLRDHTGAVRVLQTHCTRTDPPIASSSSSSSSTSTSTSTST
jgi:hypothetical protein